MSFHRFHIKMEYISEFVIQNIGRFFTQISYRDLLKNSIAAFRETLFAIIISLFIKHKIRINNNNVNSIQLNL